MAAEAPRRRPRRGSLERPVSTRIYRAAWLVVAVPVLVAAFSVGRPDALPAPRVQPFFDRGTAVQFASEFANQFPNRSPGTEGQREATDWVEQQLRGYDFDVERQTFSAEIPGVGHPGAGQPRRRRAAHRAGEHPVEPGRRRHGPSRQRRPLPGRQRQRIGDRRAAGAGARPRKRLALAPDRPRLHRRRRVRRPRRRPLRRAAGASPAASPLSSTSTRSGRAARRGSSSRATPPASRARPCSRRRTRPSRRRPSVTPKRPGALAQLVDLAFPFSFYEQAPVRLARRPGRDDHDRQQPPAPARGRHAREPRTRSGSASSAGPRRCSSARSTSRPRSHPGRSPTSTSERGSSTAGRCS